MVASAASGALTPSGGGPTAGAELWPSPRVAWRHIPRHRRAPFPAEDRALDRFGRRLVDSAATEDVGCERDEYPSCAGTETRRPVEDRGGGGGEWTREPPDRNAPAGPAPVGSGAGRQ